ncbi:MAG TPA: hypothetical protein DDW27_09250, partial [Bacteroidales bacterium]|nr:hypothetical protein [Bacteroidales bacterium]
VCPTGAITLFSIDAKPDLYMGTAVIQTENCYLANNRECIKCREACKYNAVEFLPGSNVLNMLPVIDTRKCVGCGACEVVCPAACISVMSLMQEEMPQRQKLAQSQYNTVMNFLKARLM